MCMTSTLSQLKCMARFSVTKLVLSATSGKNLTVFLNPPFPLLHITITFMALLELEKYTIRNKNQKSVQHCKVPP